VSLLRRFKIAAPTQLPLALPELMAQGERWCSLPPPVQVAALSLLARMIAAGVIEEGPDDDVHG
jgi:hypothetical protein